MGSACGILSHNDVARYNSIRPYFQEDMPWMLFSHFKSEELLQFIESISDPSDREFLVNFNRKMSKWFILDASKLRCSNFLTWNSTGSNFFSARFSMSEVHHELRNPPPRIRKFATEVRLVDINNIQSYTDLPCAVVCAVPLWLVIRVFIVNSGQSFSIW